MEVTQRKQNFPVVKSPEILAFLILVAFLLFCSSFLFLELVDGLSPRRSEKVSALTKAVS